MKNTLLASSILVLSTVSFAHVAPAPVSASTSSAEPTLGYSMSSRTVHDLTGWTAVNAVTGEAFEITELIPEPIEAPAGTVTPRLIDDPIAYAACFGVGAPQFPDFPLRTYPSVPGGNSPVYLQCGPINAKTYGWHHIQKEHQPQWETRLAQGGIPLSWDDLMAISTEAVLTEPTRWTVEYGGKRCYTAPVEIINPQQQVVLDFSPSVVVSMTNNRVITSYPTTQSDCNRVAAWV
ncbi:MAG: hypothetical protein K0R99_4779 [Microbacterium sp.]|nr:hypothetical protein [Microbacterium sp.]